MSKLRKVQFFRNSNLTAYANHDAAVTAAKAAWVVQGFANMEDGELLLYRYTITGETGTPAHTIVGVVRNDGTNKYFEVLANYDMFSGSISSLNVTDYAQAEIDTTTSPTETTITIKGIQENAGLISAADDPMEDTPIKVDGIYNGSTNKIATQGTVANAIAALDSVADADDTTAQSGHATITTTTPSADFKVLNSVTEADGKLTAADAYQLKKVAATGAAADVSIADSGSLFTATNVEDALAEVQGNVQTVQGNLETVAASIKDGKIQWNNGTTVDNIFSANTNSDLILNQYDFVYNNGTLKLNTSTNNPTSATNQIATMNDIASLSGAMHYKGGIAEVTTTQPTAGEYYTASVDGTTYYLRTTTSGTATSKTAEAGDTLIVAGTSNVSPFETGDMFVYNNASDANVVNTNLTLGMGTGEVAANQTALTTNEIVVAGNTGVQTTGYTIGGEVGTQSVTALPTAKQVYDAIQGLAVNSVSETVGVGTVTNGASITDTLTVDGSASTQTVNVVATQGVSVTPDAGTQTITLAAKVATYAHEGDNTTVSTAQASNLLKTDANGDLSVSDTWDCGTY